MRTPWTWLLGAGVLIVPLAIVYLPAVQSPDSPVVDPPSGQTVICPVGPTKATVYASGSVPISGGPVTAPPTALGEQITLADQSAATVLRSDKRFVAGAYTAEGTTLGWVNCAGARTTTILHIARPKTADLLLTNADDVEAAVDVTLLGASGEINAVGSSGIMLSPHSSRTVPISTFVADDTPIGVRVQTSSGRVSAVGRTWSTSSADFSAGTGVSVDQIVPGLPADAQHTSLLVTNPGTERATINVRAFSQRALDLANAQNIAVEPQSTIALDVAKAIGSDPVALRVTSDQPVAASAVTDLGGDAAIVPSVEPVLVGGLYAPGGGTLSVSNPTDAPVTVTLTIKPSGGAQPPATEMTLAAGQTWTAPAPVASAVSYELLATTPVVAAVSVTGSSGVFVAPFASLAATTGSGVKLGYDVRLR